jgi:hypothetical protein
LIFLFVLIYIYGLGFSVCTIEYDVSFLVWHYRSLVLFLSLKRLRWSSTEPRTTNRIQVHTICPAVFFLSLLRESSQNAGIHTLDCQECVAVRTSLAKFLSSLLP